MTTILAEFKDEGIDRLNSVLSAQTSDSSSDSFAVGGGFAVKMSGVLDRQGGDKVMMEKINSLLAAALFALCGAAVISQLRTEAE